MCRNFACLMRKHQSFNMFRLLETIRLWIIRRLKVLIVLTLIVGFSVKFMNQKQKNTYSFDWISMEYPVRQRVATEIHNPTPGTEFNQVRLKNHEKWVITTDVRYSTSLTDKFKDRWSVVPTSEQFRCSVLSKDLPTQVIKMIKHGARYIYLTTQSSESLPSIIQSFHFHNTSYVVQYAGDYQNPLTLHFHGAPDRNSLNKNKAFTYTFQMRNTSLIQKLVQPSTSSVKFDDRAPPMLLASGQSSWFNVDNILFDYGAFWALTPDFGEDAQWSLIVQRLLQELDDSVLFRTMKGVVASSCSQPSTDVTRLQIDLKEWQCSSTTASFFQCIKDLCDYMVGKQYLKKSNSDRVTDWLKQLLTIGYSEPQLIAKSKIPSHYVFDMIYYPPIKLTYAEHPESRFKKWCPTRLPKCPIQNSINMKSFKPFEDLLLVLLFNRPGHYDYLDYLENLYRPHFKYIIACGEDINGFRKEAKRLNTTLSFFQVDKESYHDGYRNEHCLQQVIKIGYDVNGFVLVNDDVLVNMWNLVNMPRNKVWYQQSIRPANLTQLRVPDVWRNPSWWPWQSFEGRIAIKRGIDELNLTRTTNPKIQSFFNLLAKNAHGENRVFYEVSDMYYIPSILKDLYHYFISVFSRQKVYSEIAITTAISGITDFNDIHTINATYLWYGDRVKYKEAFRYGTVYQHPVKYGPCFKDPKCKKFICEEYLPCVVELQTL